MVYVVVIIVLIGVVAISISNPDLGERQSCNLIRVDHLVSANYRTVTVQLEDGTLADMDQPTVSSGTLVCKEDMHVSQK